MEDERATTTAGPVTVEVLSDRLLRPVDSANVFEETLERLLQIVKLGFVPPGSRLPSERDLAARLGVSRQTIREAVRALTQAGLPLPPSLATVLGRGLIDPLVGALDWLSPALRGCRVADTEYVHAGQLFYDDGAQALFRVAQGDYLRRFGPLLRQELAADLFRRGDAPDADAYRAALCPRWATPVPARLMDGVRLSATLTQILRQARQRRLDFLLDHHIDGALAFVDRIERSVR